MDLINVTDHRTGLPNDGVIGKLDHMVGNFTYGQKVFISGVESPLVARRRLHRTPHQIVPQVGTGAHADGDALGSRFTISVPTSGTIVTAILTDLAAQALPVSFLLFDKAFDSGTDDSAFDLTDGDREAFIGTVSVSTFESLNDNALGTARGSWDFVAPQGVLWVQGISRGATDTDAAGDYGVSFIYEDHS